MQFDGEERFLAVGDTMHFAWSDLTGEIGVSPLEKLGVTIRLEDAAQRYQTASFRNGVRHSSAYILPPDVEMDPEDKEALRQQIQAQQGGVDKAFQMALVSGGGDIKPLSFTAVEAELIEQRKLNREEVGMVYDLAGPLMNDLTHGTYSNIEELNKGLYRDVLPPWLSLIEQTFQAQLIDSELGWASRFCAFDLSAKLKGTPAELATALKTQVEAGLITRNEARTILNMPPLDDPAADTATVNANNQAPLAAMNSGTSPENQ